MNSNVVLCWDLVTKGLKFYNYDQFLKDAKTDQKIEEKN